MKIISPVKMLKEVELLSHGDATLKMHTKKILVRKHA